MRMMMMRMVWRLVVTEIEEGTTVNTPMNDNPLKTVMYSLQCSVLVVSR